MWFFQRFIDRCIRAHVNLTRIQEAYVEAHLTTTVMNTTGGEVGLCSLHLASPASSVIRHRAVETFMHHPPSTFTMTCLPADHSDIQDSTYYEVTSASPRVSPTRVSPRLACDVGIRNSREDSGKLVEERAGWYINQVQTRQVLTLQVLPGNVHCDAQRAGFIRQR